MKDIRLRNISGSVDFTLRTDMVNTSDQNFTIMTRTDNSVSPGGEVLRHKKLLDQIKRLPNNLSVIRSFALANELEATVRSSAGAVEQTLAPLVSDASDSQS